MLTLNAGCPDSLLSCRTVRSKRERQILRRAGSIGCVIFTVLFCAVTFLPILEPWVTFLSTPWTDQAAGTLIVLAGDSNIDHILGLTSYWRLGLCRAGMAAWRVSADSVHRRRRACGIDAGFRGCAGRSEQCDSARNALSHDARAGVVCERDAARHLGTEDPADQRLSCASGFAGVQEGGSGRNCADRSQMRLHKQMGRLDARWNVFLELSRETAKYFYYRWKGWI